MSLVAFRSDIQGLRAIAVIAVMVFHFNPVLLPGGFIGVDVFLVISGFLITSILLRKKNQTDYSLVRTLKSFYISRFTRIAPAYFVMLVVVALVAAVLFIADDFRAFGDGFRSALYFSSNSYFADFGDYFAPANHEQPLLHTWSLAVEIQFYLLAPLLILTLPVRALKWVLAALFFVFTISAEYRMRILGLEQETYYSLYARLPEFFAGCLVALHLNTSTFKSAAFRWFPGVGLLLILIAMIAQPYLGYFPGVSALIPVVGSALVLLSPNQGALSLFLSNKGLVWVGALSYSLYIWHWPVLAFLRYYTGAEVLDVFFGCLFLVLTIAFSVASYYFVERPFRQRWQWQYKLVAYSALGLVVFGASQSMATLNAHYSPRELPVEYRRYADPDEICHGQIVGTCLRGDLNSARELLVLGDSHAAMLNHFFDRVGNELGFKARIITASSCVTLPGFDYKRLPKWAQSACVEQITEASNYIEDVQTIVVAGMWTYQTESIRFRTAFHEFAGFIAESGKTLVVLSQVPELSRNPLRAYRFDFLGLDSKASRGQTESNAVRAANRVMAGLGAIEFVNLSGLALFESPPIFRGELTYFDDHHLNEVGATRYAEQAIPILRELLLHEIE